MNQIFADIFKENWTDARQMFESCVKEAGGKIDSVKIEQAGPRGESLSIGIGILSFAEGRVVPCHPDLEANLAVHVAGVHGVEGFAGSAAQLFWLKAIKEALPVTSKAHSVVLVHTANPWGMSWLRRVNGQNVDLNRNGLKQGVSYPDSSAYSHVIRPIMMDQGVTKTLWLPRLLKAAIKYGFDPVTQALTGGQYIDPDGYYFGGWCWQQELSALRDYLAHRFPGANDVFAVDLHTGLGPYGAESLFAYEGVAAADVKHMANLIKRSISYNEIDGKASFVSNGGFAGVLYEAWPRADIKYILQEFGTFGPVTMLRGFYNEHHSWMDKDFGPNHKNSEELKNLFFPKDQAWRISVAKRAFDLLEVVRSEGFKQ